MRSYAYYERLGLRTRVLNRLRGLFRSAPLEGFLQRRTQGRPLGSFWVKLIPPEYTYAPGSWRTVERHGLRWRLDLSNANDHGVFFDPGYAGDRILFNLVRPQSTVVDIGGNIGFYALRFARKATQGRVVTFEPHPGTFAKLQANKALNNVPNLTAVNLGIGPEERTHRLHQVVASNSGMNRIITTAEVDPDLPFAEIRVVPLAKGLEGTDIGKVDLLKIDVEGFEDAVLQGSADVIQRDRPVLFIEVYDANLKENGSSARMLADRIAGWGYTVREAITGREITPVTDLTDCAKRVKGCEGTGPVTSRSWH
jgi:FkbM family methyltransferase